MKLFMTLEDGDNKVENVLELNENGASDHDKYGAIIEEMVWNLEELIEAKRLTEHTD